MRADMFKVIVERPRAGISRARVTPIPTPKDDRNWMPVSRARGSKYLNENLAPLQRFLRRSVGRHWDDVFAEICKNLSVRSPVQKHVRDHLKDLVVLRVVETDGELGVEGHGGFRLLESSRARLYVCPRTRILKVLLPVPRKLQARRLSPVTWVRADHAAFVFQDQWWLVTVRPIATPEVWDVMLQRSFTATHGAPWALRHLYGREGITGVARRALTRAEVKKLGLKREQR